MRKRTDMPILVDHQLQEQIPRDILDFPIAFYCDELADLPNRAGPMHWHPYFEIATAQSGVLDCQVGQTHTILEPGDSIFINPNMLHGIRQVSGVEPDHLPIILFSGTVIAPENSAVYQKYIQPILACSSLPFVVFRHDNDLWNHVRQQIHAAHCAMREQPDCYELMVQRNICCVLEAIFRNFDALPKSEAEHAGAPAKNAVIYLRELRPDDYAGRYCWRRQCQPKRSGAVFSILPGVFSGGGTHSVPPSNSTASAAADNTDLAGDQLCLRVSFCKLLQPSISQKVRIFTWRKKNSG